MDAKIKMYKCLSFSHDSCFQKLIQKFEPASKQYTAEIRMKLEQYELAQMNKNTKTKAAKLPSNLSDFTPSFLFL